MIEQPITNDKQPTIYYDEEQFTCGGTGEINGTYANDVITCGGTKEDRRIIIWER